MIVAPGWVDVHTHYDGQATWDPNLAPSSWHGVTTLLFGNCGVGFAPCRPDQRETLVKLMEGIEDIPEVVMVHGISGPEDFMLVVVARDLDHYSEVLQKRLHRLPSVRQVHTHFSLQDFKGQIGNLPIPPA